MYKAKLDVVRAKWPEELAGFTDRDLAYEYSCFEQSEYFGDDDKYFLEWIFLTDG